MDRWIGTKRLGPKRLGAKTSRGQNGLMPKRLVTNPALKTKSGILELFTVHTLEG